MGDPAEAVRREAERSARRQAAALAADDIDAVALTYLDTSGVARVKAVPTARLAHAARHGVGMSPVFDAFTSDDAITRAPGLGGPDGDLRLFPDLDRLTPLAAQPGWAWAPVDRREQSGAPHPACTRHFVHRMIAAARARGLRLSMGFETEWVLARPEPGDELVAATTGPAYGMTRVVERSDYLRDVLRALRAEGVEVLQIHPEYAPGQFEVSTAAADPRSAADDVVLVRETVRAVSAAHGLRACFAPAVVAGAVGNGCHLHLGLRSPAGEAPDTADRVDRADRADRAPDAADRADTADRADRAPDAADADRADRAGREPGGDLLRGGSGPHGLTGTGEAFLAGVLDALPALLAIGAPSPASYLRLAPSRWAGVYRCWGLENREAALRLVTGPADEPGGAHAEVKCFDAAANPYLLAGAVIAAGLAGIDAGLTLPEPVQGDPAVVAPDTPRLPRTLTEAADRLAEHAALRSALGETLHGAVLAVRRAEEERLAGREAADVVAATRWRY
jgi:glutamine synthetase